MRILADDRDVPVLRRRGLGGAVRADAFAVVDTVDEALERAAGQQHDLVGGDAAGEVAGLAARPDRAGLVLAAVELEARLAHSTTPIGSGNGPPSGCTSSSMQGPQNRGVSSSETNTFSQQGQIWNLWI